MKTIVIGRDPQCGICINDEKISRRHAVLRIHALGKMEIIDQNTPNGTFVNGVKVNPGKPFPVTRKNTVTFAKSRQLDWHDVPNPLNKIIFGVLGLIALLSIIISLIYFINNNSSSDVESFGGGSGSSSGSVYRPQSPTDENDDAGTTIGDSTEAKSSESSQKSSSGNTGYWDNELKKHSPKQSHKKEAGETNNPGTKEPQENKNPEESQQNTGLNTIL